MQSVCTCVQTVHVYMCACVWLLPSVQQLGHVFEVI